MKTVVTLVALLLFSSAVVAQLTAAEELEVKEATQIAQSGVYRGTSGQAALICGEPTGSNKFIQTYRFYKIEKHFPHSKCVEVVEQLEVQYAAEASREASEERAVRERKQREDAEAQRRRGSDLRTGKAQPTDLQELLVAAGVPDGSSLARSPMIKPDGKTYGLSGVIELAEGSTSFTARSSLGLVAEIQRSAGVGAQPFYFRVHVPQSMRAAYEKSARIGMGVLVVGKYLSNSQYRTAAGSARTMPVLELVRFEPWR